jgi:DNA-directed RNA polymerase specialized sigma24 family protein
MIGNQLHTYVQARLGRWAVWCRWNDGPTGPARVVSQLGKLRTEARCTANFTECPVDEQEARETHRCVYALGADHRDAIIQTYLRNGTSDAKAKRLGCTRMTLHNRNNAAYTRLLDLFNAADAGLPLHGDAEQARAA